MKKLLLFAVSVVFAGMANAQDCTPQINTGASTLGLNPNPMVGSIFGTAYDEVNTLIIPRAVDNTLTGPPGDSITLCGIEIINVLNVPAGYTYDVWAYHSHSPSSNYDVLAQATDTIHIMQDVAITRVCIRLKNATPPMSSDGTDGMPFKDSVAIEVVVQAWADLFGCSGLGASAQDTIPVKLCIRDYDDTGIETEDHNTFSVKSNNPNPANDFTYLNFVTPTAGDVTITLYDAVGRNVRNIKLGANPGANNYSLSTSELKSGIYIYNITFNGKTISKKLIVNR